MHFINVTLNVTSSKFSIEGRYIRVRTSLSLFLTSSNLQLDVKKYILENTVAAYTAYIYIYIYIYIYRERERERERKRGRERESASVFKKKVPLLQERKILSKQTF